LAESPTDNTLSASPTKLREVPPMVMLEVVTPALTAWELEPKATLPSTVATVFAPNATARTRCVGRSSQRGRIVPRGTCRIADRNQIGN